MCVIPSNLPVKQFYICVLLDNAALKLWGKNDWGNWGCVIIVPVEMDLGKWMIICPLKVYRTSLSG